MKINTHYSFCVSLYGIQHIRHAILASQPCEVSRTNIFVPILQKRKLRLEVIQLLSGRDRTGTQSGQLLVQCSLAAPHL